MGISESSGKGATSVALRGNQKVRRSVCFVLLAVSATSLGEVDSKDWEPDCASVTERRCYFPGGTFRMPVVRELDGGVADDAWLRNPMSWKLHRIGEPSLRMATRELVARCTAIPTWQAGTIVRIRQRDDGTFRFSAKRLKGKGGFSPTEVASETEGSIDEAVVQMFIREVRAAAVAVVPAEVIVMDGDIYVAEAVVDGKYMAVGELVGSSGREGVGVFAACQHLMQRTGFGSKDAGP